MKRCESCFNKFPREMCPAPCVQCSCQGEYCRLLGRDSSKDTKCAKCREKEAQSPSAVKQVK